MMTWRLALARSLAWALLIGGWLALGAAGRWAWPLWLGGLAAVVLWLAVIGIALQAGRAWPLSGLRLRQVVVAAGLLTSAALAWLAHGGQGVALLLASAGWGVLIVAASRGVRLLRGSVPIPVGVDVAGHSCGRLASSRASPVLPATAGAVLAWCCVGDVVGRPEVALVVGVAAAALWLAVLIPSGRAVSSACRAGLFDCALPQGGAASWRHPAGWAATSARWSMLPMMASLAAMSEWCGGAVGQTPAQVSAAHLGAMLLPATLLQFSGAAPALHVRLHQPAWAALPMAAGLACLVLWRDLQGLMVASLCHAVAWGWVWSAQLQSAQSAQGVQGMHGARSEPDAPVVPRLAAPLRWRDSLLPALLVGLLGLALAAAGPHALVAVHAGLGGIALAGLVAALSVMAWMTQRAQTWQHEVAKHLH